MAKKLREDSLELRADNPRECRPNTVEDLVCNGLKYCCLFYFFTRFADKSSELIAARLGCSARTIRVYQERRRAADLACPGGKRCFKSWGLDPRQP